MGINNLMEDAATAEISRSQVWQWIQGGFTLSNGQTVTRELVEKIVDEEMAKIAEAKGDADANGRWDEARATFAEMALAETYADFLTLPAYERMPRVCSRDGHGKGTTWSRDQVPRGTTP